VEEAGGKLTVEHRPDGTTAAVELPLVGAPELVVAPLAPDAELRPGQSLATIDPGHRGPEEPERHLVAVESVGPLAPVIALPLQRP
jgi:hypothetical protein